jgi:hypothetical protein
MLMPFTPQHLAAITIQEGQAHETVGEREAEFAREMGPCWSWIADGEVMASGGLFVVNEGLAIGWAYLAKDAGRAMWPIIKAMRAALSAAPVDRVDFLVLDTFPQAHRMARVLKATETRKIDVTSRDGQVRSYTVYSRGRGNGWH